MNRRGFRLLETDDLSKIKPRHVLVLVAVEAGQSYSQIAKTLGIPEGTVKSRISRARAAVEALRSSK